MVCSGYPNVMSSGGAAAGTSCTPSIHETMAEEMMLRLSDVLCISP